MLQALTLYCPSESETHVNRALPMSARSLLAYGDPRPVQGWTRHDRMARWLHQPTPMPVAPVTAAMDLADFDASAFWVRLDPVHLVPDRDTLVLFPAVDIGITEAEALALITAFNQHFHGDGVRLEYGAPDRWYVRVAQPVDIQTVPLPQAVGANLHYVQPQGSAVRYWNRLINEAQMLFFQHPVNETRREKGLPEINGLWLWGEGVLPELRAREGLQIVDPQGEPFLQALSGLIRADYRKEMLESLAACEVQALFVHVQDLDETLLSQVHGLLQNKQVREVLVDLGGETAWYLKPSHLRRFWRRWFSPL